MKRFYVYEDWTCEPVPRCFYVGKGTERRVSSLRRNKKHVSVSKKHGQNRVIVFESCDEASAFALEVDLIAKRQTFTTGSDGVFGCNFTRGGEGPSGRTSPLKGMKRSQETCRRISENKRGKPTHWARPKSEAFKSAIRQALTGIKRSDETRLKVSRGLQGNSNRSKSVRQFSPAGHLLAVHSSLNQALAAIHRVQPKPIRNCCNGKQEIAYGCVWEWA